MAIACGAAVGGPLRLREDALPAVRRQAQKPVDRQRSVAQHTPRSHADQRTTQRPPLSIQHLSRESVGLAIAAIGSQTNGRSTAGGKPMSTPCTWYNSKRASVPTDPIAFFSWFFTQQEGWGLSMYEQDWMVRHCLSLAFHCLFTAFALAFQCLFTAFR